MVSQDQSHHDLSMDQAACFIREEWEDKIVPLVAKVYTAKNVFL